MASLWMAVPASAMTQVKGNDRGAGVGPPRPAQWNCSSSVEPFSALTLEVPPWITVVTSSK